MSMPAAEVSEEGFTIPVAKERTLFVPSHAHRPLLGGRNGTVPRVFKVSERIVQSDMVVEQGAWFWLNREQGLWASAKCMHNANLAFAHTNSGYGYADVFADDGELQWLEHFITTTEDAVYILADWKGMSANQRDRLSRRIADVINVPGMHAPRNDHKVRMRWRAGTSVDFTDSLKRPNPGATRAKLSTASVDAKKRQAEIRRIARFVDGRRVLVRQEENIAMSVARTTHQQLRNLLGRWSEQRAREIADQINALIRAMGLVVDQPWRNIFRRTVEDDLQYAAQFAGQPQGKKYVDRAMVMFELTELYPELANLDLRLAITLDQHPRLARRVDRKEMKLRHLKDELELQIKHLPVRIERGSALPGVDKDFRGAVTPKLYRRLMRANAAWVREDWEGAKANLRDALHAFG